MVFFRIKKIKGKEYAYIVENKWKAKGSRQKVKGYLGKIYRFNIKNDIDFSRFVKIESAEEYSKENSFKKIISDLVEWEIFRYNIDKNKFSIDLNSMKIQQNKKNAVLLINEGFMCSMTLKNMLEFRPEGDEPDDGYRLARALVEAGIKVPQEIFVSLFGKIYKSSV